MRDRFVFFFFQAEDGIRDYKVTGVQTCALPILSRSLQACEGAILVVDASQGIEAQTLSNLFLAMDAGLEIIPILNKIDLPGAEPERRRKEVSDLLGIEEESILLVSAKEGIGIG